MSGSGNRASIPPTLESLSVVRDAGNPAKIVELQMKFWTKSEVSEVSPTLDSIASMASLEPGLKLCKKETQFLNDGTSDTLQLQGPHKSVIHFYDTLLKKFSANKFLEETLEDNEVCKVLKLYKQLGQHMQDRSILMPPVYLSVGAATGSIRRLTSIEQGSDFLSSQTFNRIADEKQEIGGTGIPHNQLRSLNFIMQPCLPDFHRDLISKNLDHTTNNIRFNCLRASLNHDRGYPRYGSSNNFEAGTEGQSISSLSSLQLLATSRLKPSNLEGVTTYNSNTKSQYSQYLYISGFDLREYNIVNLCNLFGNYGNIEVAYYNENLGECMLMFTNVQGARYAKDNLDRISVQGNIIKVNYSAGRIDDLSLSDRLPIKFAPLKRFSTKGSGLPNQANPVSKTLHLTYSCDSDTVLLDDSTLLFWLSNSGEVVRLKRELFKKKKNMWFAEFRSETEAVRVLMREHGKMFQGGVLRVSFTKTI